MTTDRSRTWAATVLALAAFAANSILCRRALGHGAIDPATFSTIRVAAGALTLAALARWTQESGARSGGSWGSAALLCSYAIPFSFAYVSLGAGPGALILFASVQVTMLAIALRSGERPHVLQWAGLVLALGGLVYLVLPGLAAPSPAGCALMITAGMSWGFYSLRGRRAESPLLETAGNFVRAVPLAALVSLATVSRFELRTEGAVLAIASGALTSGLGYVAWYAAIDGLTATRAATVQLAVPAIAAAGGVLLLSEPVTARLIVSAILILGGVGLALSRRST
jgi:drug/metabolite transporter (DMT)-like permease